MPHGITICQYGERCKFLHVTSQQSKPNVFGFGMQTSMPFQGSNSQQQKPNPFGFGVQGSAQRGGSNEIRPQFKPFENKWSRFSSTNAGGSQSSQQPDNQPMSASHKCTDPELCKRQIIEDFEHERPLWKLTCYGHGKSSPCDITGDISFEELRAVAYDDAKRGLSLQSIVERERSLLNTKLLEFESLLRNPYSVPRDAAAIANQGAFPGATPSLSSLTAQNSNAPSVSSFSQLGASLNLVSAAKAASPQNNAFVQPSPVQLPNQTTHLFGTNNSPFGFPGSLGSQPRSQFPNQSLGSSLALDTSTFSNNAATAEQNPFAASMAWPQIPNSAGVQFPILPNGLNTISTAVGQVSATVDTRSDSVQSENGGVDDSIWLKEKWNPGEIPEIAPPAKYIF
ncbi:zinc finger CCCH domain-containing protein 16 isoform X2 [Diospyros lotus]|uniref:zinc finger CCCH domain-containing protein 16 isoform X2 n=1 Tax=Diospyros lotus TaxID=55363 RepID=UPI002252BCB3|nr:zinc finger CCCH domain-containing protein 16 isoform X2 [Diospyros lotus]